MLGAYVVATLLCVGVALTKDPVPPFVPPPGATSDLDVFGRIVTRVSQGDGFYLATQEELRSHGYPTRSVFNWRLPTYAWLLGNKIGRHCGPWVLILGAIGAVVMLSRAAIEECGLLPGAMACLFLVGATAWCFGGETYLFMELWAGMLIAVSIGAFRRGRSAIGVASGLGALFYRELALPYCLVALGLAFWKGRKREAVAWVVGLLLFALFLTYHSQMVRARLTDADLALEGGWVRFGGIRFILLTAQTNVFLMSLPLWCTAVYLPLAVAGLAGARDESGLRAALATFLYLAAFSVVGNRFNVYWGFIDAPLLALGLGYAPRTLSRLVEAAFPIGHRREPALAPLDARGRAGHRENPMCADLSTGPARSLEGGFERPIGADYNGMVWSRSVTGAPVPAKESRLQSDSWHAGLPPRPLPKV
jgi:hypothetical protein